MLATGATFQIASSRRPSIKGDSSSAIRRGVIEGGLIVAALAERLERPSSINRDIEMYLSLHLDLGLFLEVIGVLPVPLQQRNIRSGDYAPVSGIGEI